MNKTLESETARAEQLALNGRWLIAQFDKCHAALGLEQSGGWVQRVEQVVQAVENLKKQ